MNEVVEQPTGIRAFGWGLAGFFGANIIVNALVTGGELIWQDLHDPLAISAWFVGSVLLGLYLAYLFATSRHYDATKKGAFFSITMQSIVFVLGMIVGYTS